jgi:hypothetical protein
MAVIKTRPCVVCGIAGEVEVTDAELLAYTAKAGPIQNILPRLTDAEREMLISGSHSECFDTLFPPEDEDDEEPDEDEKVF